MAARYVHLPIEDSRERCNCIKLCRDNFNLSSLSLPQPGLAIRQCPSDFVRDNKGEKVTDKEQLILLGRRSA